MDSICFFIEVFKIIREIYVAVVIWILMTRYRIQGWPFMSMLSAIVVLKSQEFLGRIDLAL
jgi:hypothetical protein